MRVRIAAKSQPPRHREVQLTPDGGRPPMEQDGGEREAARGDETENCGEEKKNRLPGARKRRPSWIRK